MPLTQVMGVRCPCCGEEMELVLVGSAHEPEELAPKLRRARRSKTAQAFEQMDASLAEAADGDGDGPVRP